MIHVPYRGDAADADRLLGGQIQVLSRHLRSQFVAHIKAGTLRPLAVTDCNAFGSLPDIPTVGEFVPGYEASGWCGIVAPRNTPIEIVDKLNRRSIRPRRSQAQVAVYRLGCPGVPGFARRVRQTHRGGDGKMGQSHPNRRCQARLILAQKSGFNIP